MQNSDNEMQNLYFLPTLPITNQRDKIEQDYLDNYSILPYNNQKNLQVLFKTTESDPLWQIKCLKINNDLNSFPSQKSEYLVGQLVFIEIQTAKNTRYYDKLKY